MQLAPMSATGHLPVRPMGPGALRWSSDVGRDHGFDDVAVIKDKPGDLVDVRRGPVGRPLPVRHGAQHRSSTSTPAATAGSRSPRRRRDVGQRGSRERHPGRGCPAGGARAGHVSSAAASARGDLPGSFADELLSAPDHDGALAILLEAGGGHRPAVRRRSGRTCSAELADGLFCSVDRVSRSGRRRPCSRPAAPPRAGRPGAGPRPGPASRCSAVPGALGSNGPWSGRWRRSRRCDVPATLAAVVRRPRAIPPSPWTASRGGVTTLLVESFDDLAGLALGVEGWIPVSVEEITRLLRRLARGHGCSRRLSRRAAEHGRARLLVAVVTSGAAQMAGALRRLGGAVRVPAFPRKAPPRRAARPTSRRSPA